MSPEDRRQSELSRPELPDVTRLNRNVLLVAGMGVGVVVLAVTHVVRSDARPMATDPGTIPAEAGAVASFLQDPPQQGAGVMPIPPPAYPGRAQDLGGESLAAAGGSNAAAAYASAPYDPYAAAYASPPAPARPDPRQEAYQRALRAGLRSQSAGAEPVSDMAAVLASNLGGAAMEPSLTGMPINRLAVGAAARPAAMPVSRNHHEEFLAVAADSREAPTYIASRVQDPISEYQIMAGTVLPAMMVTEINSDLPGEILGQISRNIYDSQQRHLLIPRGTKVIGRYDSQVALGQSRVLIAWTRLIFPDGRSLSLPGLPTQDLRGAAGLRSRVDNHYGRLYGQAILLSIIGAGAQLSQPQQSTVFVPPSAGQVAAGALGQELSQVSMETIRRNMDVRPTLQVRPGTPFYIFLERDLILEGPYTESN